MQHRLSALCFFAPFTWGLASCSSSEPSPPPPPLCEIVDPPNIAAAMGRSLDEELTNTAEVCSFLMGPEGSGPELLGVDYFSEGVPEEYWDISTDENVEPLEGVGDRAQLSKFASGGSVEYWNVRIVAEQDGAGVHVYAGGPSEAAPTSLLRIIARSVLEQR